MKTKRVIIAIDSHCCGETTRLVVSGFPKIPGKSMTEKTANCKIHFDHLRKALALQPRGFQAILGAIMTEPCNPKADAGLIYYYADGYFNACGDSTFSSCKILLEFGMVEKEEPETEIVFDTAGGLLKCKVQVNRGVVGDISYDAVPSFHQESTVLKVKGVGELPTDIAFGGLWYSIVDADEAGVIVDTKYSDKLIHMGMRIVKAANEQVKVKHPVLPELNKIELAQFSAKPLLKHHDYRHCNIFGSGNFCVSPAGTSISAKLATKIAKGDLDVGEEISVESPVSPKMVMKGKAIKKVKIGDVEGIVPRLSTSAYITGASQWILETDDPIANGYQVG